MSNFIFLQPCKFVDDNGDVSFGFRMGDDYSKTYDNSLESELPKDDLETLKIVVSEHSDEVISGIVEHMKENEIGLFIRDVQYDWDEIKDILENL